MREDAESIKQECNLQVAELKYKMEEETAKCKKVMAERFAEWELEKQALEKQLATAKDQLEDSQNLCNSLKLAMDKASAKQSTEQDQARVLEMNKVAQ